MIHAKVRTYAYIWRIRDFSLARLRQLARTQL